MVRSISKNCDWTEWSTIYSNQFNEFNKIVILYVSITKFESLKFYLKTSMIFSICFSIAEEEFH